MSNRKVYVLQLGLLEIPGRLRRGNESRDNLYQSEYQQSDERYSVLEMQFLGDVSTCSILFSNR